VGFIRRKKVSSGKTRWYPIIEHGGQQHSCGGYSTRRDAEARLRTVESRIAEGLTVEAALDKDGRRSPIFEDFYESWIKTKRGSLKPSSLVSYEEAFKLHILPYFSGRCISDITPLDIQGWINQLSDTSLAPASVGGCYRYLRACLKQAENWDLIAKCPCRSINLPRVNREELNFLDPSDINVLLEAAEPPGRDLFALLVWSGLRLGEGLALAWKHIDFESNAIIVERSWSPHARDSFLEPKTPGSRRAVPMLPRLRTYLEELYRSRGRPGPDALLFSHSGAQPLDPGNLRRAFEKALKTANLKHVSIHSLRHTYASASLASGCSIKALQRALGHSSAMMTLNTYSHLIQEDLGSSLMRTDAIFDGANGKVLAFQRQV
jgi:integrase